MVAAAAFAVFVFALLGIDRALAWAESHDPATRRRRALDALERIVGGDE